MLDICKEIKDDFLARAACEVAAHEYYAIVFAYGGEFYRQAQDQGCEWRKDCCRWMRPM